MLTIGNFGFAQNAFSSISYIVFSWNFFYSGAVFEIRQLSNANDVC
jgi:hypothetical protein